MDTLVRMLRSSSTRAIVCFIWGDLRLAGGLARPADGMNPNCGATRMESEQNMADVSPAGQARRLLRAARVGTLATSAGGQPFASLVTPACAPDLGILL